MKSFRSQTGQGTAEYVILLGLIVAIALTVFYTPLKEAISSKVQTIASQITSS